jgi:hypothetical protein
VRRCLLIGILLLGCLVPAANAAAADDDRIVLSSPVVVDRGESVNDVVVFHGDVTIRGAVRGDVVVFDGDVTIRGTVRGDVVAFSGLTTLGRRGRVAGDLVYGDDKPVRAPGSRVGGKVEKFKIGDASIIGAIALWVTFTISMILLGVILLLLAPKAGAAIARTAKAKALIAGLVGLLAFFLIPLIAILACVTVVGLPLGILLLLLIVPLYVISYCAAALVVGRLILKKAVVLAFIVGIVILQVLTLIPIVGGLIGFVATFFGLGVVLMTILRARR